MGTADRERFLSDSCADSAALRTKVRTILATVETINHRAGETVVARESHQSARVPKRIGKYHIRREIGSGGMGAVYEALQENPKRRVAIKVLKSSVASEAARKRFEYESQVLGRLKHPGIAEIYEAGTYDDGDGPMPYFAMEYISGRKNLIEFALEKKLDRDKRLALFTQICDALHHGHQKGVVHRDLKPGNILVDGEGRPRIIDFGVARATDSDVALATMQTEVGQIIGTIEYMSPEQCEGDPELVDVRSDIYALGVVLFELLTGERPRKLDGTSIYEAIKTIRESVPTRMGMVDRTLRGDLETIVGKAMERDADRRYQSALEFKQDIDRFLASEPIEARPPSLAYQSKMFAKRHKGAAAGIVLVALILVLTTGWSLLERDRASRAAGLAVAAEAQAQRAAEQARAAETKATEGRDAAIAAEAATAAALVRAEAEKARTVQTMEFVTGIFQLANPANAQGRQLGMLEIFQEATAQIDSVFAQEPAMAGELYATIGGIQLEFGDIDNAESNLVKALVLAEREHGTSSLEALSAGVLLAAVMVEQGRYDEADSRLDAILSRTKIIGEEARAIGLQAHRWQLEVRGNQLRIAEAVELARDMVKESREIHGLDHEETVRCEVDLVGFILANLRISGQEIPEEFEYAYGSLERVRSIVGDLHPIMLRARQAEVMRLLPGGNSNSQTVLGSEKMMELLDGIVTDSRLVLGDTHLRTLEALYLQGIARVFSGDVDSGSSILTEAYAGYVENHSSEHPVALQIATMLGGTLLNLERVEEALPMLKASWRGQRKRWGEEDIRTISSEGTYALALLMIGRFEEGNPIFESAMLHHDLFSNSMMGESRFRMLITKLSAELKFELIKDAFATTERLFAVARGATETSARSRWAYSVQSIVFFIDAGLLEEARALSMELLIFIDELFAEDPGQNLTVRLTLGHRFLEAGATESAGQVFAGGLSLVEEEGVPTIIAGRVLMLAGLAATRSLRTEEAALFFEQGLEKLMGGPIGDPERRALIDAMARNKGEETRRLLEKARDACEDPAQRAIYEGLLEEFPAQE